MSVRMTPVDQPVHAALKFERDRIERRMQGVWHDRPDAQALVELPVREQFRHRRPRRIRVAAAQHFERETNLADRPAHFILAVGLAARRKIAVEHEGDFRFYPDGRRTGDNPERAGRSVDRGRENRRDDDTSRRRQRALPPADRLARQLDDAALDRERRVDVVGAAGIGQKRAGDAGATGHKQMPRRIVDALESVCHVVFASSRNEWAARRHAPAGRKRDR
ncbi:protein of unknown function [Burkholderia multivorans]